MQSFEDDLAKLQQNARIGDVATLGKQLHSLQQNPLWHDMRVAIVELKQLETNTQTQNEELKASIVALQSQLSIAQIGEIERRLSLLEAACRAAHSTVSLAEDASQIAMTTLMERVQVLESKIREASKGTATKGTPENTPHFYRFFTGRVETPGNTPEKPRK